MATQLATARQPFAPLNSSRLQNLTSLKNRQNALASPIKRKAASFEADNDNSENIDPIIFLSPKRSKCPDGSSKDTTFTKPVNYFLTPAPPSPSPNAFSLKPSVSPRRPILPARSQVHKLDTAASRSTSLSAPAGRSPTRKRIGILNRRKTASPFTRVDPPKFNASSTTTSSLGFSIDAALSGTIPSYSARQKIAAQLKELPASLNEQEAKESWFFAIHEDTEEELATNLMEHSTCTLDISSDEESAARERDMRGKENVPPPDDVSQTRTRISDVAQVEAEMGEMKARARALRRKRDQGEIDIDRSPLGNLAAEDFYAEGCDGESVFVISDSDVEDLEVQAQDGSDVPSSLTFDFTAEVKGKGREIDVDSLMQRDDFEAGKKAALLEPIEKADEGFEVWESSSAKGDD